MCNSHNFVRYLLNVFTATCLRHPIQMTGFETVWELHTLTVMNSWLNFYHIIQTLNIIAHSNVVHVQYLIRILM